jgi:hypothetical protein
MNYVLALFLPPLSILLSGRPVLSVIVLLIWIPAIVFSGGLTHPMFIALAWIIIYERRQDRRRRLSLFSKEDNGPKFVADAEVGQG